ncbi:MAG TPA: tetratricopeptide repeat protein, partial [Caulobacteraceae bacterium]|nr:tetratricopeptide repeat protein [Caulobacteraceae bacterium]
MTADTDAKTLASQFDGATAAMKAGRWPEALAGYGEVLQLQPGHIPSLNNRGIVLSRLGRIAEALASFEAALAINPSDPIALNNSGEELQKLMRPHEALASYDAAIALEPQFAAAHGNRGYLLSQMGRTDESVQALERAIALQPGNPRFYHHLAPLRRFAPGDPILAQMQRLGAGALSPEARIELGFALGKALADIGEHEASFEQLSDANRRMRSSFRYDEAAALSELEHIGTLFGADFQARMAGAGLSDPAPVLIVGMPRSGSTLVEQILASHPKAFAAGERPDLELVIGDELQRAGLAASPDGAAQLPPASIRAIGQAYARRLHALAPAADRIVDKTLSNLRFLGLVHAALPQASMVHVRRGAVDVCVSCYSRLFGGDQPFAYDLGELGRYHVAVDRLMRRWRDVLPAGVLLELEYEALIADPEGQALRLLEHCGLDWDPGCLEFHRTDRQVRTSSAAQVRRPLYSAAVGASRVYERHLGPLFEALGIDPKPDAAPEAVCYGNAMGEPGAMAVTELEQKAAAGDIAAQKALAEMLDAEGRHDEAIDWLARAGKAGDLDALTRVGVRLLTGKDAPFLPLDGARLIGNAAQAGGIEAMERLAVLIGGGFFARQNWAVALDILQTAGKAGSASAEAQLRLLGGEAIDLDAWTRAPEPRVLSDSPRALVVEKLIPPEVCAWIIEQSAPRLAPAELYDPATGKPVTGIETRLNRIANFSLTDTQLLNVMMQARMAAAIGAPMAMLESFAVLHYRPGEEYGEHVDYLDPAIPAYAAELARAGQRVATCL